MKVKHMSTACLVVIVSLAFLLPAAQAQPRRGGRGGQGGGRDRQAMMEIMRAMRAIESYWTALTFELKVDDAKLTKLRPAFQAAWDARKDARAKGDRESLVSVIKAINSDLEAALKEVLSENQMKKLKEIAARGQRRGFTGGRGGGMRGGRGGIK